ncbi:MAG: shikimate kinase [Anaerolineae bacterium]
MEVMSGKPLTKGNFANIILTGFMGTGKTSVGLEVARRLGRPFVDMDAEIEARTGKSIATIFSEEGEPRFRNLEAEMCRELSARRGLVIATGGGALLDEENRRCMSDSGLVICLTCQVEEILRRLSESDDRPLLAVSERKREIESLLARRRAAYEAIPHRIDTTGLTVDEVAEQVIALWQIKLGEWRLGNGE